MAWTAALSVIEWLQLIWSVVIAMLHKSCRSRATLPIIEGPIVLSLCGIIVYYGLDSSTVNHGMAAIDLVCIYCHVAQVLHGISANCTMRAVWTPTSSAFDMLTIDHMLLYTGAVGETARYKSLPLPTVANSATQFCHPAVQPVQVGQLVLS